MNELRPSIWQRNKCICSYVKEILDKITMLHRLKNNDPRITQLTALLKDLVALRDNYNNNGNEYYAKHRIELAKKYNAWRELFDIDSPEEALQVVEEINNEQGGIAG